MVSRRSPDIVKGFLSSEFSNKNTNIIVEQAALASPTYGGSALGMSRL